VRGEQRASVRRREHRDLSRKDVAVQCVNAVGGPGQRHEREAGASSTSLSMLSFIAGLPFDRIGCVQHLVGAICREGKLTKAGSIAV